MQNHFRNRADKRKFRSVHERLEQAAGFYPHENSRKPLQHVSGDIQNYARPRIRTFSLQVRISLCLFRSFVMLFIHRRAGGRLVGFLDAIAAELNKWIIKVERNLEKPKSSREKEEKFDGENESCRKRKLEATPNGSQNKRQKQVEEKELNISFPSMANFFSTDDVNAKQETSLSDNEISEVSHCGL